MPRKKPTIIVYTIYSLSHPETGELRYVGQTSQSPRVRFLGHLQSARTVKTDRRPVTDWIRKLMNDGLQPIQKVLYETYSEDDVNRMEVSAIRGLRRRKYRLLNLQSGGNCPRGLKRSEEAKRKTSETLKRLYQTKSSHLKGRKLSPEHKAQLAAAAVRGNKNWTRERKDAVAERNRKVWSDPILSRIYTARRVASRLSKRPELEAKIRHCNQCGRVKDRVYKHKNGKQYGCSVCDKANCKAYNRKIALKKKQAAQS